jgi:glycosyltransferase involved in cell wall biosynthesis
MRLGVLARNLFVDWFGGSTRTNRELLIRLTGRRGFEVDFVPIVDEVYWKYRGSPSFRNMVLRWVETYRTLGIYVNEALINHYINGDLHKFWGDLLTKVLTDYDLIYDPILMPTAYPQMGAQLFQLINLDHALLRYFRVNERGKALVLTIGCGDVPLKLGWAFRFARRFLVHNYRRVASLGLFIERCKTLINSLLRYRDRVLFLLPSIGLLRKMPMLKESMYKLFYPFYAVDERVKNVSLRDKDDFVIFFSRLDLTKGILELPEIIAYMRRLGCDVPVKIIGGFEDKSTEKAFWRRVKAFNIKGIEYLGYVPDDNKIRAYEKLASARALVYPSHSDVVPNVVVESLFLKTPVVMYNIAGPFEVFGGTNYVHFVPEFNTKAMAREVCMLLHDHDINVDDKLMEIVRVHNDWELAVNNFIKSVIEFGDDKS